MKLIIDIPEYIIEDMKECGFIPDEDNEELYKAIDNSTPIPDNATNGDVIRAMFDVTEEHFYDEDRMVDVYGLDRTDDPSTFYADWWNSLYQKGGK